MDTLQIYDRRYVILERDQTATLRRGTILVHARSSTFLVCADYMTCFLFLIFFLSTFCLKFDSIANTVQCSKFELIARKANSPITFVGRLSAVLVGAQPELLG